MSHDRRMHATPVDRLAVIGKGPVWREFHAEFERARQRVSRVLISGSKSGSGEDITLEEGWKARHER